MKDMELRVTYRRDDQGGLALWVYRRRKHICTLQVDALDQAQLFKGVAKAPYIFGELRACTGEEGWCGDCPDKDTDRCFKTAITKALQKKEVRG
jgi:hypothetical protein